MCFQIVGSGQYVDYWASSGTNNTGAKIYGILYITSPSTRNIDTSGVQNVNSGATLHYDPAVETDVATGKYCAWFEHVERGPNTEWVTVGYAGPACNTVDA